MVKIKGEISLRIDTDILKKFKMLSVDKEKSYSSYIQELMEAELKKES